MRFSANAHDLVGAQLADDLRGAGFDIEDQQIVWYDGEVFLPDDLGDQTAIKAVVTAHLATPPDTTMSDALRTRAARSAAVVEPTAQLLQAVVDRLTAARVAATPDGDMILILEAVRQLALKSISDEAAAGSREYADLYLSHVPDAPL